MLAVEVGQHISAHLSGTDGVQTFLQMLQKHDLNFLTAGT